LITGGLNPNLLGQFTFNYQVTLGPPAIIQIISGNNQQGQPGQPLAHSLVAQVTDIAGNPLAGIQLLFKAVVTGTVALSNVNSVSDVHGLVSATATPASNVSGPVQVSIQTTDGKIFSTFTINVAVTVGQILKSGDQQTANTLQPFADPLTVTVNDTHGNPISGVQVNFAVIQGAGTLQGSPIAVTNSQGQASASVTAGDIPGTLVITATVAANGAQTVVTFNLTVKMPGPNCTPGQTFYNGAGLQPNYISPGGIATIYCVGLAQGIQGSVVPGRRRLVDLRHRSRPRGYFRGSQRSDLQRVQLQRARVGQRSGPCRSPRGRKCPRDHHRRRRQYHWCHRNYSANRSWRV